MLILLLKLGQLLRVQSLQELGVVALRLEMTVSLGAPPPLPQKPQLALRRKSYFSRSRLHLVTPS